MVGPTRIGWESPQLGLVRPVYYHNARKKIDKAPQAYTTFFCISLSTPQYEQDTERSATATIVVDPKNMGKKQKKGHK
jgi:hypothetical protein